MIVGEGRRSRTLTATGVRHNIAAWKLTDPNGLSRLSAGLSEPTTTMSASADNRLSTAAGSPGRRSTRISSDGCRAETLARSRDSIIFACVTTSAYWAGFRKQEDSGTAFTKCRRRPRSSALWAAQSAACRPVLVPSAPASTSRTSRPRSITPVCPLPVASPVP
jgi:hypothetical protein